MILAVLSIKPNIYALSTGETEKKRLLIIYHFLLDKTNRTIIVFIVYLTVETDYAVRSILYLAESPDEVAVVEDIARTKEAPAGFLAKILQKLARAGIVKSSRGVRGGFSLAKKPADISLFDVVVAIEGAVAMNKCAVDKKICGLSNTCPVHPVWVEMRKEAERRLKSYDFAKLTASKK